jgi:hypothetical protein
MARSEANTLSARAFTIESIHEFHFWLWIGYFILLADVGIGTSTRPKIIVVKPRRLH